MDLLQMIKEAQIGLQVIIKNIILGNGVRLFEENNKKIKLEFKEIKEENGLVTGIYIKK